jgi:hypothetical protein
MMSLKRKLLLIQLYQYLRPRCCLLNEERLGEFSHHDSQNNNEVRTTAKSSSECVCDGCVSSVRTLRREASFDLVQEICSRTVAVCVTNIAIHWSAKGQFCLNAFAVPLGDG